MRRVSVFVLAAALAAGLAACNNKSSSTVPTPPTKSGSTIPTPSTISVPPGSYGYDSYGLTATMTPTGDKTYSLKVINKTGVSGQVAIYELDARTGKHIDGTVDPAESVPDGQTKTFTVTFPSDFDSHQVGLMIITLDNKNFGAFVAGK